MVQVSRDYQVIIPYRFFNYTMKMLSIDEERLVGIVRSK